MISKHLVKCVMTFLSAFCLCLTGYAQQKPITGTVLNANDQSPLPFISIVIKGTTSGAKTDAAGKFSLNLPADKNTVVVSGIGFQTQEVVLNTPTITISLVPNIENLSDVVVVGYGTAKKATLTGSVTAVKSAELLKSPQPNISNSLVGRMPGLIAPNTSGEPGYDDARLMIRGVATTGNAAPLIVVDGVPNALGGFSRLNPGDIESITILKDASAAIYGSQAANGVILVTTKKGEAGKTNFNFSLNQGFIKPTRLPQFVDAATYATIVNEIGYYNNPSQGKNQRYTDAEIELFRNGKDPVSYPNTDWNKEVMKPIAPQTTANLSFSGGTNKLNYYISGGYLNQEGLYRNSPLNYKQYNVRANFDINFSTRFKATVQLSGRQEEKTALAGFGASNVFEFLYRTYPTLPAYYPNGMMGAGVEMGKNPLAMAQLSGADKRPITTGNIVGKASYDLYKGLAIDGMVSIDKRFEFDKQLAQNWIVYQYDKNAKTYNPVKGGPNNPSMSESQTNNTLLNSFLRLSYDRHFGKHQVSAFAAIQQSKITYENFGAGRQNYITTQLPELSQGGSLPTDASNYGSSYIITRRSYFGRISYNYAEKYLVDVQLREDGSSIFAPGRQYGFFPSVLAAWRVSEESWFNKNTINSLKLRASYGMLGNENIAPDQGPGYQYLQNLSLQNGMLSTLNNAGQTYGSNIPTIMYAKLANPNITWETAKKANIGLDASLFNHFNVTLDVFTETRSNILAPRNLSIPGVSGISSNQIPDENIGKVTNKGVEASVMYETHFNDVKFNIGGNFSFIKNKVIFLDEAPGTLPWQKVEGHPINAGLYYRAIGIFKDQAQIDATPHAPGTQPGDLILEDYDGDKQITAADRVRTDVNNIPQIVYGITLGASWKNFDLSVLLQGQGNSAQYLLWESGEFGSFLKQWADNRWSPENTNASWPRPVSRPNSSNLGAYPSTFWNWNTSFIRLKNLELGYNLPQSLLSRASIKAARFYVNGFNLLTFTRLKEIDPEGTDLSGYFYPQQKVFNVGVNVNF
ncbi:SusC/RagA family TonB-linked outer membrane protein [Chitinophaga arvensicola]|uniref:TonB-linked outer membrane protein, SusC/RagA family n=1 Tax=Chitinophaga arvensicola TaxID=29529 RepID=A0A1I0RRB1_9BACT|nr:TonB-dependent receptor [Chitinophaga arvensicola]SEW43888.1 TonB-linked outer membrane protein, SusC/RagA family [Chitinophaga arvensicola]